ncbi:MAG: SAF domain-containing protein [Acidimicrobiaceae bacterium]|nr:SAF domain-containing protein [Acidimicrobiaceae bacterium]
MAIVGVRLSPRALRFAAAGLVVLLVAVSVWLFGRPPPPPPTVAVVAATEPWPAGHEPGDFTTIEVPASAARLFVTPAGLHGRVPAVPIPAGAVLSSAMLADPAATASNPEATLVTVGADLSLWPPPGPAPGDTAVLSRHPGGCAAAVLPVLATTDTQLVVEANPERAALLADTGQWVAWKSPSAGWPECDIDPATASDPEATLVAVGADLSLWPPPGPAPGDTAVLSRHPGGCAAAVLPVLATTVDRLVVEVTPALAEELSPYQWWAWEASVEQWPQCERPIDAAGVN